MFKNQGLKRRMFALSVTLACGSLIVSAVEIAALREVSSRFTHTRRVELPGAELTGSLLGYSKDIVTAVTQLGLTGLTADEASQITRKMENGIGSYAATEQELLSIPMSTEARSALQAVSLKWKAMLAQSERLARISSSRLPADHLRYLALLKTDFEKARRSYQFAVENFMSVQQTQSASWAEHSAQVVSLALAISVAVAFLAFVAALGIGFLFSRSLSSTLSGIAERLSKEADEVASASRKISSSSEALSSSATEQAAALEETAASIEQMGAMVNRNAENANKSRDVSSTSQATATRGRQVVDEMIRAIGEISDSNAHIMKEIESSNKQISDIVTVIGEIGNKTKVINDIVFQTKLLSFNASVEAARAGEHGKGFAVVAEEVGNLAQMSGTASREISAMLDGSIQKVETIVRDTRGKVEKLVQAGHDKVQMGTEIARRCGEVLAEIVRNVSEVNKMAGEISSASDDQAQGVQGITKAISQLDQVTQETAQSAHHAATAAIQLSEQVENLRGMAKTLVRTVQGEQGKAGLPPKRQGGTQEPRETGATSDRSASSEGKVIPFKAPAATSAPLPQKKAVGLVGGVPSEDDPRFNDV